MPGLDRCAVQFATEQPRTARARHCGRVGLHVVVVTDGAEAETDAPDLGSHSNTKVAATDWVLGLSADLEQPLPTSP